MAMQLERETEASLEEKVDRLENTVKALARESASVNLHGPCPSCDDCHLFVRHGRMYCPHCGDGQNI